jgi:hypothetical protein
VSRRRLTPVIAVAVAAAAAAGCGGDEGIPTGDVSKRQYIAQADQICAAGDRAINRAGREHFGPGGTLGLQEGEEPSRQQIASFVEETVIPNIQGQLDDLRELEAPEADAEQIEEIYETAQDSLDALGEDPSAAAGEDGNPFAQANRLARAYGMKDCGG